jgi:hypothetical protein
MRTRKREDRIFYPDKYYLGWTGLDITGPVYGDGPWVGVSEKYYGPAAGSWAIQDEWCVDELHHGPPYKEGGPFQKWAFITDQYVPKAHETQASKGFYYLEIPDSSEVHPHEPYLHDHETGEGVDKEVGGYAPTIMPSVYLSYANLADFMASGASDPSSYGAKAWNRFRPTRSGAELGVFLGEIDEVPRMLKTTAKGFSDLWKSQFGRKTALLDLFRKKGSLAPKGAANHWLNTQFGWLPFVHDLRDLYETTRNLDKKLKQLRRDNGKWIRRGGTVKREETTEILENNSNVFGLQPFGASPLYASPMGRRLIVRKHDHRIWFRGAFRYWIPGKPDTWLWNARAIAQLYGLYPSPSVIWELTPWSWLIDWWEDAGDAIANLSSIMYDNLCAKYAFLMSHWQQTVVYVGSVNYHPETGCGTVEKTFYASLDAKERLEASPFGFGSTSGDFSARQWSILSALGISKLKLKF